MRKPFIGIISIIIFAFFINFVKLYTLTNTKLVVSDWGDGYKQLVEYVHGKKSQYNRVVISGHYWQPYMYFLFYDKFDPLTFQKTGSPEHFDKYIFGGTSWDLKVGRSELNHTNIRQMAGAGRVLVALSPEEYKDQEQNLLSTTNIVDHNNKTVFIVGDLK